MSTWMKNLQPWGIVYAPDGRESGSVRSNKWTDDLPDSDRFDALMSLALDDQLSPSEEAEFDRLLTEDPDLDELWCDWQAFDFAFQTAPSLEPPINFVASFENRLLKQERRRKLWLGFGIGLIAILLWGSLIMGLAGAGAYVMFNQSDWLTATVRIVVQSSAAIQSQLAMFAAAATTAFGTPQVQGMVIAYVLFAGLALWYWARFLRRSVGTEPSVTASVL